MGDGDEGRGGDVNAPYDNENDLTLADLPNDSYGPHDCDSVKTSVVKLAFAVALFTLIAICVFALARYFPKTR